MPTVANQQANPGVESQIIVRGYNDCEYHADILQKFCTSELGIHDELRDNWVAECPGGGRLNVNEEEKSIQIYGYSQGFGRCDHQVTEALIKEAMPDHSTSWSNEGY